jgi:hypothetical protein
MKVIALPSSLRRAIGLLALAVPLAALEVVFVTRANWWQLPKQSIGTAAGLTAAVVIVLALGFSRARSWAWWMLALISAAWCAANAWMSLRMSLPALGFLTIFLFFFLGGLLMRLRSELRRSYFDPGLRWFQGEPEPISFLKCSIQAPGGSAEFRVSRLDREGAFLFGADGTRRDPGFFGRGETQELVFQFRDRQLRCPARPMRYFNRSASGAGFRFQDLSLDSRKQLGDFIENLRGEGYVE